MKATIMNISYNRDSMKLARLTSLILRPPQS